MSVEIRPMSGRLEFQSIEIEHFKSFATKQAFDFSTYQPGLTFVRGRNDVEPRLSANGAGKSTLFGDAITWVLYGKTVSGLKNPDIRPWASNKTPCVTLHITLDGKPHKITRTATTNGLKIDYQEVGSEEAAKLISLDFEVFTNTILLAQGAPLFFDRSPKDKMQLFTDVLNLERWEDRSAAAATKTKTLEQLEAELEGELTGAIALQEQTLELLTKTKERSAEWEAARSQQSAGSTALLKQKRALLAGQRTKLGNAELAWDSAATELKALRATLPNLNQQVRATSNQHDTALVKVSGLKAELKRLNSELDALDKAKECPTCGQPIKQSNLKLHKAELLDRVSDTEEAIERFDLKLLRTAFEQASAQLALASKHVEEFASKEDKALTTLNYLKPQVVQLEAEISALNSAQASREEERNPYTEQHRDLQRKQTQAELNIKELKADLIKAARQIERTKFWIKGFKDVKLYLIEEVLQELELTTNIILSEVGLDGWAVKFDVEKETKSGTIQRGLNVAIHSPSNKQAVRYESWSGGEGQRLRVVGALALSEVLLNHAGVSCDLEVLDEPTRHLSAAGVKDLCEFLGERAKRLGKKSLLIDHSAREGSMFNGTITVVKTAKGSVIEG